MADAKEILPKTFKVNCGDWIFPAQGSASGVEYSIPMPVVAEIFRSDDSPISSRSGIPYHLTGPRYLEVSLATAGILRILSLKSTAESRFSETIDFDIPYDFGKLERAEDLFSPGGRNPRTAGSDWNGIFFTSVLLQNYQKEREFPKGIRFRNATMAEIESLGKW